MIADGAATTGTTVAPGTSVSVSLPATPARAVSRRAPASPAASSAPAGRHQLQREQRGTPVALPTDIDGDEIRDSWEREYGLDTQSADDWSLDNDLDGLTNRESSWRTPRR